MKQDTYQNPLIERYGTGQMKSLFSEYEKVLTMRKIWFHLAEAQKEAGLEIGCDQIREMELHLENIDFAKIELYEKQTHHDVMANILAFGDVAPHAKPIIHLGATSTDVTDNADLFLYKQAIEVLKKKMITLLDQLASFSLRYKNLPSLGFTHLQPAQLTTVGKRSSLWLNDLVKDFERLVDCQEGLALKGLKGATGSQASYLHLFNGDKEKVRIMEASFSAKLGFNSVEPIASQTYSRKVDYDLLCVLSGIAQSAYKFSNDLRILQHMREIEEPFDDSQVGSSAMPYKRNPMRSERISSLARYVITLPVNAAMTASTQWLERTLDDSANRRIVIPHAFLAVDAILNIYMNITKNMTVYPKMIHKRLMEELPFLATENILMEAVKRGGDRQVLHERLRGLTHKAAKEIKEEGLPNRLRESLSEDSSFSFVAEPSFTGFDPDSHVGLCADQVETFIRETVAPLIESYASYKNQFSLFEK